MFLLDKSKFYCWFVLFTSADFSFMLGKTSTSWCWSFSKITYHIFLCRIQRTKRMWLYINYLDFLQLNTIIWIKNICIELRIFPTSVFYIFYCSMTEIIKGRAGFSSSRIEAIQSVGNGATADEEIGYLSILSSSQASYCC